MKAFAALQFLTFCTLLAFTAGAKAPQSTRQSASAAERKAGENKPQTSSSFASKSPLLASPGTVTVSAEEANKKLIDAGYIAEHGPEIPLFDENGKSKDVMTILPETTYTDTNGQTVRRRAVVQQWWDGEWHVPETAPMTPEELLAEGTLADEASIAAEEEAKKKAKEEEEQRAKQEEELAKKEAKRKADAEKNARRAELRQRRLRRKAAINRKWPATCSCAAGKKGSGICYDFVQKGSSFCTRRSCLPSYTCAGRATGLTCFRRRVRKRVVPVGLNTCKQKRVRGRVFMYVPYASA